MVKTNDDINCPLMKTSFILSYIQLISKHFCREFSLNFLRNQTLNLLFHPSKFFKFSDFTK
jgi:hypothetical protein